MAMTRGDLEHILRTSGVPEDGYDLNGGYLSERYTIKLSSHIWSVYYSEKGVETGLMEFSSEDSACTYFLNLIRNDNYYGKWLR